jgi:hypothetical protein
MQTIDKMAEELLKAINQIIPSVTSDEKYTAAQVCVVALHHAEVAISERRDHLRARQCLFALTSFRELAKRPRGRSSRRWLHLCRRAQEKQD